MGSLSIWTFYRNNKRKVLPVVGIVALAIVGIASSGVLTGSLYKDQEREIAFFDHYALVFSSLRAGLSEAVVETVEGHSTVAETVRMEHRQTYRQGLFGRNSTSIFFVAEKDQRPFADRLGWNLVEGRWPESGTNEIAMTQDFLRNRGLGVGDLIGQAVDEDEWLAGEWLMVGALGGSIIGGVGDLGYLQEHFLDLPGQTESVEIQPGALAVIAIPGGEAELEALLESLPKDEVAVVYRSKVRRNFERLRANLDTILWILNAMSIAVMSLALGLLNVIFFMQRGNEFGLLAAIGYTKGILMRRVFLETTVMVIAGWVLGILLSIGIYSMLNAVIFIPRGLEPLSVLTVRVLVFTLPVPATVILFGVAVVMWQLHRMDPVAIIERRD